MHKSFFDDISKTESDISVHFFITVLEFINNGRDQGLTSENQEGRRIFHDF